MSPINRPLAYLLGSFCCGIVAGRHLPIAPRIVVALAIPLSILLCWRTVRGKGSLLLPLAIFVVMGALASTSIPDPAQPPSGIRNLLLHKSVVIIGSIVHSIERSSSYARIYLRLEAVKEGDSWHTVSGNLLLSIRECRQQWSVGQRLLGRIRVKPVRNFNNPGGFNYRQYLADQRIWIRGYVRRDTDLVPLGKPGHNWGYLLDSIRTRSRVFLEAWLPPDFAGLYRALLLGERYALSAELRELLYNAGIGHLLAISGLHLGLVAGFAFLAFHFILVRIPAVAGRWGARPGAALAAFPVALAYGLLTGMGLPALRATLMLVVFTFALVIQREKDLFNALLLAALIILSYYPEALFTASFQLSCIGVAALVWILPILPVVRPFRRQVGREEKWCRKGRRLYQFICGSLILSFFTAPVVLYHFHRLTTAGIVTNLVAVPLVGFLVLPAGLLALFSLPFSTLLAGFLATIGSLGLKIVVALAAKFGSLSWTTFWPGTPKAWQVGFAYVMLLAPFMKTTRWRRASLLMFASLVLVASWLIPGFFRSAQSFLRVTYLDVSQGSSAVVEFPGNIVMLIDGGGFHGGSFDLGRHVIAPYLWHRRISRLKVMVLSHAHPDHFQGLRFVATHFPTRTFWHNKVPSDDPDFVLFMKQLAQKDVLRLGPQELRFGQNIQGVDVQVLHPPPYFSPTPKIPTDKELNNLSLVLRLTYENVSFLFPGDIGKETEHRLVKLPRLEPVDVLLVPHHGSRTSSSLEFLQRLRPRIAVYSVGFDNPFHLPSSRVLERYRALGVKTYRTDRHGAITIRSDGHNIEVETFLDEDKP